MDHTTRRTDQELQEALLSLCQIGAMTRLDDITGFLKKHDNPHENLQVYHIAGTNGKGSVCAMITSVLSTQYGKKVGHIVSPHLVSVRERIQINGQKIASDDMLRLGSMISQKADQYGIVLSFFSFMVLIAIRYFVEQGVDVCVFEVGAGGRYDATNIRKKPLATAITSIGFDHAKLLGSTLEEIQRHKMGVMKPGVPCYTWLDNTVMKRGAADADARLCIVTQARETNLLGAHQNRNAGIVYDMLTDQGYDAAGVLAGLQRVVHPGRMQMLRPWLLVDGAHNRQGIKALNEYITSCCDRFDELVIVFGTTKNWHDMFAMMDILPRGDRNFVVEPSYMKSKTVSAGTLAAFLPFPVEKRDSLQELLLQLEEESLQKNMVVVVYGSLYLAGDCLRCMED